MVGIIEVQKQDTGETYDTRFYPEEMFSTSNMNNVNFPYAYIYQEEVKNPKGIHILADVGKKKKSADVVQYYLDDEVCRILKTSKDSRICKNNTNVLN